MAAMRLMRTLLHRPENVRNEPKVTYAASFSDVCLRPHTVWLVAPTFVEFVDVGLYVWEWLFLSVAKRCVHCTWCVCFA